jgi:acyl-CoA reductase-like NAD-dependent aldehyde dehydrogenase
MKRHALLATEPACFIAGEWSDGGGERFSSVSPTALDEVVAVRSADAEDVTAAVAAARAAAPGWSRLAPVERQDGLLEVASRLESRSQEFVALVVEEVGKPLREAREEVDRTVDIVRYHAVSALDPSGATIPNPQGRAFVFTDREPVGTVGLITPWNFPVAIPLWKLAPALALGNTVILKPAPPATGIALRLATLFSHLPPGVFNLVPGEAATGQHLARSDLDGLSFTGSSAVGRVVAAAALDRGVRFQAEMGGKNASVVLADADLERAADVVARAAMGFAGQKCTATSRVIVEEPVADPFIDALVARLEALTVGSPADEETDVGPLIAPAAVARVAGFVERAVAEGGEVAVGGRPVTTLGPSFYEPTLVLDARPESEAAQTEIFGPVLVTLRARDADDALELANSVEYGLAAAVFTRSLEQGLRFGRTLAAGIVRVNGPTPGVVFNAPFGPRGHSGIGLPEQGKAAREFFTLERTVSIVME